MDILQELAESGQTPRPALLPDTQPPRRLDKGRQECAEAASQLLPAQTADLRAACADVMAQVPAELDAARQLPALPASCINDGTGAVLRMTGPSLACARYEPATSLGSSARCCSAAAKWRLNCSACRLLEHFVPCKTCC